jgi:hypothetical protein
MNPRNTWLWLLAAVALFAFIFFVERRFHHAGEGPTRVLPGLNAASVTGVQVLHKGQVEINATRTNGSWQLRAPLNYSGNPARIESLLAFLERLVPAAYISAGDLSDRFNSDDKFGFTEPQATIILDHGELTRLRVGDRTAPGDQVFLQVVGNDGIYVVDADLLKFVPATANDWRDDTLLDLNGLAFDRISVTNSGRNFEVQREGGTNGLWHILRPTPARADQARIQTALQGLEHGRISGFISDDPKADLESLGLQPAELEIGFSLGTNLVAGLQFGKSLTNRPTQIYARRAREATIVAVPSDLLAAWRATDFRDPHLIGAVGGVQGIDVQAEDTFSLQRQTNGGWQVMSANFAADSGLVKDLLSFLGELQVSLVKGVVTEPDLPTYGLSSPVCTYILKGPTNAPESAVDTPAMVELKFGTNTDDKVFARRTDESSVYGVKPADFAALRRMASASWCMREREIWRCSSNDLAGVTVRYQGKERKLLRKAAYQWSLAPGSQGIIEDIRLEETVRPITQLAASVWTARGLQNRDKYGFSDKDLQVTLDLQNGNRWTVEFGAQAPSGFQYAGVTLEGEFWIFEFHPLLYRDVLMYLAP